MNEFQVTLFGKLRITSERRKVILFESSKSEELLGFLLLFRARPHTRDVIADALWEDTANDRSRSYLRRTLWQLQHVLGEQSGNSDQPLLQVEQNWLQINPLADVSIDVAILEDAYASVRGIPGENLSEGDVRLVDTAVDRYQGQLLEGWYQKWCIYERERLQHIYLAMLDKLMRYSETHSQFEEGIEYGLRILRLDQAREYTHRQLMRLYYLACDRSAAMHQYERCLKALQEELGVQPTRRTRMLYEEIKRDSGTTLLVPNQPDPGEDDGQQLALQDLLQEMQRVRSDARRLESRIDRQISSIRRLLNE